MRRLPPLGGAAFLLAAAVIFGMACEPEGSEAEREYLRAFCALFDRFSDDLTGADSGPSISAALGDYVGALESLETPADLADYHAEYLAYVRAIIADSGRLAAGDPPKPGREVRRRLVALERDLPECDRARLFAP